LLEWIANQTEPDRQRALRGGPEVLTTIASMAVVVVSRRNCRSPFRKAPWPIAKR